MADEVFFGGPAGGAMANRINPYLPAGYKARLAEMGHHLCRYRGLSRDAAHKELQRIMDAPNHLTPYREASIAALEEVMVRGR